MAQRRPDGARSHLTRSEGVRAAARYREVMRVNLWASLALVACHHASPPSDAATPPSALASASAASAVPSAPVGLATFAAPSREAIAKNDHGVGLLAAGKAAEAAADLEAALALAPDFVLARYNLACARARAGDFEAAARELESVFEADFIGMRAHATNEDTDLAAFWKSPAGARVTAKIPNYEARYRVVIDRGVRAILWRAGSGGRGIVSPSLARPGVWDPDTRRFVAVAPPSREAFFAFSASLVPFAVLATGSVRDMLGGDLDAGKSLSRVLVYPISTAGTPVATFAVSTEPQTATLSLGATSSSLHVFSSVGIGGDANQPAALWNATYGSAATMKPAKPEERSSVMKPTRDRPVVIELGYNHWGYPVEESDGAYAYAAPMLALPTGEKIEIPKKLAFYKGPARTIASPAGDRVALTWNAAVLACDPARTIPGRYKMALVDTKTGAVSSLGEGDGAGAVSFTKSGRMFVQRGARVFEVSPAGEAPLPDEVRLVPDVQRDDQCGF